MTRRLLASALAVTLLATADATAAHAQRSTATPPRDIDEYVERVMRTFEVPGVALAIVKDGEVLLARGYGVRELGRRDRVDPHTMFGIASNTKAFTATALGMLVEEGLVEWDASVVDYLPWFRLSDPYVTAEMTVRDLLVHRSGLGLGAGDLLWWPASTYTRDEIARRLRFIPLESSFRSAYAYDNVLYLIAGQVIEAVSGMSWEAFIETRILAAIGMTDSDPRHSGAAHGGNVATTHARIDGTVRPIAPFTSDNTNPAGGIMSSATDMARWMIVQLDSGRVAGAERLWQPGTTRELWQMVTPIPIGEPAARLAPLRSDFFGYALGFFVRDYRGHRMVMHTGGLPGYVSRVMMIPELKLGIAVLTNQESGAAFDAIAYHVVDQWILPPRSHDWLGAFEWAAARGAERVAALDSAAATQRDSASGPSLALDAYAGTYRDRWYGDVVIERGADGALDIRMLPTPLLVGDLVHWQHDTFLARWHDRELRADAFVTFVLDPAGEVDEVRMVPASPSVDFSYDFQHLELRPVEQ